MEKNKRNYNVFFNTHTVSGIAISIGIYICFFAGAYALFLKEINNWQHDLKAEVSPIKNYERVLNTVQEEGYQLEGRSISMQRHQLDRGEISVSSGPMAFDSLQIKNGAITKQDSLAHAAIYLLIDPVTYEIKSKERSARNGDLGTFLYHLHFFQQIPTVGIFLAGLVSLFLVFSIITGLIIHWKKIGSNFFTFRLKSSIKNLWTDGHTALGIIGLPFQLMYGVTGAFLGIVVFAYMPMFLVLDGNTQEIAQLIYPNESPKTESNLSNERVDINGLIEQSVAKLELSEIEGIGVNLSDYGKTNASVNVSISMDEQRHFANSTSTKYRLSDGAVIKHNPLEEHSYAYYPRLLMKKIHYATFGGYFMKVVYFLLALATCYVILSGVMIWLVAREKKTYAHRAKFNRNVGAIFIGACMGLYPAIALIFCLVKMLPDNFGLASNIFFLFWLAFIIYSYFIKSTFRINKHALIVAGVLGILIPVFNGTQSGLWFWKSYGMGYLDSFFVDVSWLVMSVITLWAAWKAKPVDKKQRVGVEAGIIPATAAKKITISEPILTTNPSSN
ncbi:MAG: PepSY-associated TM helix domain-containing protein [Bacteroidota bacterium]